MDASSQAGPDCDMVDDAVLASIVHEVKQPLTAIVASAAAGFRFLEHSPPDLDRAREAFRRIAADGERAGALVEGIGVNGFAHLGADIARDFGDPA